MTKKILDEMNNTVRIEIVSALELSENRKVQIQNKLKEKLNKNISTNYNIDNSIIAGLVYKIGDDVLDTSFQHKLEMLKDELIRG